MVQLQIAYLPRPGTQERWRRLCQEVAGSRRDRFAASCQQVGITQVQVSVVQLRRNELLFITLDMQEPQQALSKLVSSAQPFDRWLREQFRLLLGWNLQEVLPGQHHDLIFTWSNEHADSS